MSNGGFVLHPEQEPKEEPTFESKPEAIPSPTVEQEGLDEVAVAELKALKEMAEKKAEEAPEHFLEEAAEEMEASSAATGTAEPVAVEQPKDEVLKEVEKILEEDLGALVSGMSPDDRAKFEKKGLEVSGQIANMVRAFKLKMSKVVSLIREWLHTIPGVNKYFLEQEAKIKADKIMDLEEAMKTDTQNQV